LVLLKLTHVGDLSGNFEKIVRAYERLAAAGAELVLTPELAIRVSAQDLVFKSRFVPENLKSPEQLHARVGKVAFAGRFRRFVTRTRKPFLRRRFARSRQTDCKAHKSLLPTYDVF